MGAPSEPTVAATYRFVDLPLPRRLRTESMDSLPGVRLSWSIDASELVKSIRIFRSTGFDTGYALLAEIAPSDTVYVDATAREMVKYFYYLDMTGFMDEVSGKTPRFHGIYQSTLPPLPPYRLEARGFDSGVRLSWRWAGDEPEGFYVYRCPGIDDTLVQVSGLLPVTGEVVEFVDSSASLSPYTTYGYGISAESKSHVRSPIAETAYARPDLPTEPKEPFDLNAQVAEGRVSLYWSDMRPASRGLVEYHVSRRVLPEDGEPSELARLTESPIPAEVNSYVDSAVEAGTRYEYAVQSIDAFGGESPTSVPVRVTVGQAGVVPPAGLSAVVNGDAITVGWNDTAQDSIAGYRLYRYERGGEVELVAELDPRATSYEDGRVGRSRLYFYHLTCFDSRGRESDPSEEVSIRFE